MLMMTQEIQLVFQMVQQQTIILTITTTTYSLIKFKEKHKKRVSIEDVVNCLFEDGGYMESENAVQTIRNDCKNEVVSATN